MTIPGAIELMRNAVSEPAAEQCKLMMALADIWEEAEAMVKCDFRRDGDPDYSCISGQYQDIVECRDGVWRNGWRNCPRCSPDGLGTGFISNGNSARAEALRLLAECGKVGRKNHGYGTDPWEGDSDVPAEWFENSIGPLYGDRDTFEDIIGNRLVLMDAYAAADRPTREKWEREIRDLIVIS